MASFAKVALRRLAVQGNDPLRGADAFSALAGLKAPISYFGVIRNMLGADAFSALAGLKVAVVAVVAALAAGRRCLFSPCWVESSRKQQPQIN